MFDLSGKVAFVTGGSRGIGRACAVALAQSGCRVVISYVGGEAAAAETVATIEAAGGQAEAIKFDVSNMEATEQAVAETAKRLGRLDIMVANAGISIDGLLIRMKEADLDRTLAVNVKGALACAKAAIKPMVRTKGGRIIFISSVVGETGNAGQAAYAASKGALLGVAKSLAREYASRAITVNAVTPGYIETDMTHALNDEQQRAMLTGVPLARAGTAREVAAAVVFLASDEAAYITGHTMKVNGGMYM
jgi:3-oxoacyl-[acyl-carrier protein] reductase